MGYIEYDVKDITTRYANDVIASCAFGLKINSHANEENEFYERGKEATTFGFVQMLKFFLITSFPKLFSVSLSVHGFFFISVNQLISTGIGRFQSSIVG